MTTKPPGNDASFAAIRHLWWRVWGWLCGWKDYDEIREELGFTRAVRMTRDERLERVDVARRWLSYRADYVTPVNGGLAPIPPHMKRADLAVVYAWADGFARDVVALGDELERDGSP